MSPTRWAIARALSWMLLAAVLGPPAAEAQYYEPAVRSLEFVTGSLQRSPRLLGMGGLTLVIPDRNTEIELWDLGRIPVGLAFDDSTSTLDLWPGTGSVSAVHTLPAGRERQNLAARNTGALVDAVYRSRRSGSVFGVIGDLSGLQWDQPYSQDVEIRRGVLHPEVLAILGGQIHRWFDSRVSWATHLRFRSENVNDEYRAIVSNAAGEYIDQAGGLLTPPSEFTPTDVRVNTTAFGVSTAYAIGAGTKLAIGLEHEGNEITATNELQRSSSEFTEKRPYWVGQATLAGKLGKELEFGVDGIGRLSKSEADWRFSASAGVGSDPLSARGNYQKREEKASEMRARLRWSPGKASFAGALTTAAYEVTVDPPNSTDQSSFNRFLNLAFERPGTDSLAYPDSVVHNETQRFAVAWGGGASYRLGVNTVGAEYHWTRDIRGSTISSTGPKRLTWDLRGGVERPLGKQMVVRAGYAYRSVDEDEFTAGNEYIANAFSVGFGYAPASATWNMEFGYAIELRGEEYQSTADERQARQQLGLQFHWAF